jgi:hypothetical protein
VKFRFFLANRILEKHSMRFAPEKRSPRIRAEICPMQIPLQVPKGPSILRETSVLDTTTIGVLRRQRLIG